MDKLKDEAQKAQLQQWRKQYPGAWIALLAATDTAGAIGWDQQENYENILTRKCRRVIPIDGTLL